MSQIMPFVQVHIANEIEKEKEKSTEFEKAWDESREEYRLIGEMIHIRKQKKMKKSKIAKKNGKKQTGV